MGFVWGFFYSVVSLILVSLFIPLFYCFNYSSFVVNEVAQSCPTLCDPMDCSLPGSSVHGVFQARVLAWVVIPFCRGSSRPRDRTRVSCIVGRRFTIWTTVWYQGVWCLQFCCPFSRLLWLFRVFCGSIQIFRLFILFLWNMPLKFW